MTEWIGAGEAARRLGIKPATLYSYVSRGVLRRRTGEDGRSSLFDAGEVESLARRGRPRHPGAGEFVIESELTEITSNRTCYRGFDITALAAQYELEDAAWLLWTGELSGRDRGPWRASEAALRAGRAAQAALPPGTLPLERFGVIVPALAAADPLRLQLDPPAVIAAGQVIMAGLVDCLPAAAGPGVAAAAGPSVATAGGPGAAVAAGPSVAT
ncbi:MAG TPA: citrate/2-methylcitrate synthase, partial [Streptosporangiaceae bacterium]|nr:citrate/2-methylcitrate synthase [Streptosporangiaceae bacterium]